jgi:nickel-dependent lactate racemase
MTEIHLPYGHSSLSASLPDRYHVDIIEAAEVPPAKTPEQEVRAALDGLLGGVNWSDFKGARSVAIAVNDKTRPVPHHQLLPPLMERLAALGIPDKAIRFYVAGGTHPPMLPEEYPEILPGGLSEHYRVVPHDPEDYGQMVNLGETRCSTPVWVNAAYVHSDLKIVVGNIEPHQFSGFSGGVKSAAIGLAGFKTINRNHSLMNHPDSRLGKYEGNPVRQDIEEIGSKMGIQIALNAILNQQRQIVHVLAGQPQEVMRAGIALSRKACQIVANQRYALLITSPGGYPKDINLYQAQKALGHAILIARKGGTIILTAACPEGTGSASYEAWMQDKHSYQEILDRFAEEGFRIGPHKAFQIARDASRVRLLSITEMHKEFAGKLLLNPAQDLQSALNLALTDLQSGDRIGVIPHANSTIPFLDEK